MGVFYILIKIVRWHDRMAQPEGALASSIAWAGLCFFSAKMYGLKKKMYICIGI